MSFKESFKKFIGIKSKEEETKPQTPKEKAKDFFEQLLFAAIAALLIISFVVQNTRIPTGSMENTILVGDFVLVNKFIYGSSSPKYIPFTEIRLPYFRFPAFRDPKPKDIVVFEWPGDRDVLEPAEEMLTMLKDVLELREIQSKLLTKLFLLITNNSGFRRIFYTTPILQSPKV